MQERLQTLIAEILDLPTARITADLRRESTDAWDSMNHLRLITALEQAFGVQLTMDEIAGIESASQLEQIIRAHGGLLE